MFPLLVGISGGITVDGGTLYSDETYYYRQFTSNGTLRVTGGDSDGILEIDVICIAGGGGGGSIYYTNHAGGGGGGAGGVETSNTLISINSSLTVVVGAGGAFNSNGSLSRVITNVESTGGGHGGFANSAYINGRAPSSGGSGGGGGGQWQGQTISGASGIPGQGRSGGSSVGGGIINGQYANSGGGGGGGKNSSGQNSSSVNATTGGTGGNGGSGMQLWSSPYFAAAGGAGGNSVIYNGSIYYSAQANTRGLGGSSIGGTNGMVYNGTITDGSQPSANTGSGGAGASVFANPNASSTLFIFNPQNGASGSVWIRYLRSKVGG